MMVILFLIIDIFRKMNSMRNICLPNHLPFKKPVQAA
jgi:hypothetical protein